MSSSFTFHKLHSKLPKTNFDLLIRRVGDKLPVVLGKRFDEEFYQEEDKKGFRLLHGSDGKKVLTLRVISFHSFSIDEARSFRRTLELFRKSTHACHFETLRVLLSPGLCFTRELNDRATLLQLTKELLLMNEKPFSLSSSGHRPRLKPLPEKPRLFTALEVYAKNTDGPEIMEEAAIIARAIACTRELVNLPANRLTPAKLAAAAERQGARCGFTVSCRDADWIRRQGLEAYRQVARGSDEAPVFILMHYLGNPDVNKCIALVGKGLCYDSGGYHLKEGTGMGTMFTDMGGAAAVIGALSALAENKAPVNVVGIIPACENMISGHAFRNGDIIDSYAGKSIEVISTDAEGRLTLADGVSYAWKDEGAGAIIEVSTLTGAVSVAVGNHCIGAICDDEELEEASYSAFQESGDRLVYFPHDNEFEDYNKSERADIRCGGIRAASCIAAGLFVRSFAGRRPFLHLDIASTAYRRKEDDWGPAGATGVGAELLYYTVRNFFPRLMERADQIQYDANEDLYDAL